MTQAYNLSQLANFVNSSGQLNASTGLYNTTSLGFPSGTRMPFNQTAAPTGWTKDTTAAINDSILRLVTGTVSSGGSVAFSTWNASGSTGAYTLTTADMPSHTHTEKYRGGIGSGNSPQVNDTANATNFNTFNGLETAATGGGGSHSHSFSNNIKYYDFIIASKD